MNMDSITIPIKEGISEGGLIVLSILIILILLIALAIIVIWKYGANIKKMLGTVQVETTIAKEQVTNTHDINLRDDIDKKHEEVITYFKRYDEKLDEHIENTNDRFNTINDRVSGVDSRISGIDGRLIQKGI